MFPKGGSHCWQSMFLGHTGCWLELPDHSVFLGDPGLQGKGISRASTMVTEQGRERGSRAFPMETEQRTDEPQGRHRECGLYTSMLAQRCEGLTSEWSRTTLGHTAAVTPSRRRDKLTPVTKVSRATATWDRWQVPTGRLWHRARVEGVAVGKYVENQLLFRGFF